MDRIETLEQRLQNQSEISKIIAFEHFYRNQCANFGVNQSVDFSKNHFVIFSYQYHCTLGNFNLGDAIQSIATKNAIDSVCENASYEYFDRDSLAYATALQNEGGGQNRHYAESPLCKAGLPIATTFSHPKIFCPFS